MKVFIDIFGHLSPSEPSSGETKYRNDKIKSLDTLDDISLDPKELIKLKASKCLAVLAHTLFLFSSCKFRQ